MHSRSRSSTTSNARTPTAPYVRFQHRGDRISYSAQLSSLKSQHSALALTHQSALDRLALKDAEISSLKAQAAALYSKASVVRSAPSASPDPNVSVFSTAAVYAPLVRQSPKMDYPAGSPVRGSTDQKPNGAFNDYAPAFQPFLDRARDEEASERLEATKRALQSDRKFLRRRLHDSEAQVRTLTHELKRLRHHLLSAAPTIIPAPETGAVDLVEGEGEGEGEDDEDDDGPDYPYDGTPPHPRELPLPPVGDESVHRGGHHRSHTFPTAFKPRLPKTRPSKRWKRRPTMGDAEAEHLLLASRTLSSVVRPIPRPPDVMLSRGGPALTPLEAATYLPPGGGGHHRTASGGIGRVEEEDEVDDLADDGLSPKRLYGPRRTSDIRGGLPFEIHSPGRGAPLPSDTPGLIRHGKVADAPPVKRGRHGASASLGSVSAFGQQHPGAGGEVFALPQTPRSSGQHRSSVAVGSPTRSGGIEDLLAAAETVLNRSTSPSTRKRPNAEDGTPKGTTPAKRRRVEEPEGEATPKQAGGPRSSSAPLPGAEDVDDEEADHVEGTAAPAARGYPSALDVLADQAFASASQSSQESTASPPRQHAYVFPSQQPQAQRYPSVLLPAPSVSGVNGGGAYRPPSSPQHQGTSSASSYHGSRPYIPPPELTPAAAAAKKARSPYVKWTFQEDELLVRAVCEHGQRWDAVSKGVPTRSYHQCRQRWLRGLKSGENLPREL